MELTDKQKSLLISAGEFDLSIEATALKTGIEEKVLKELMSDPRSLANKYYRIGKETQMFDVYQGLKKQVLNGGTQAAKIMAEIKKKNDIAKLTYKYFGV